MGTLLSEFDKYSGGHFDSEITKAASSEGEGR